MIEILLAMAIFAIFSTGVFYLSMDTIDRDSKVVLNAKAMLYAQEGVEAVRNIKDDNFLLVANGDHGLNLSGDDWSFVVAPETVDGTYERTITVENVYRNGSGDIEDGGANLDPDTKKITSEVTWLEKGVNEESVELITYLANWRADDWIEITCDEFDDGTFDETETEEIAGPPADNCQLRLVEIPLDGEVYASADLGTHAHDVVVDGTYAYLAVDDVSNGFSVVDVSDAANPVEVADISVWGKGRYLTKAGDTIYMGVQSFLFGLSVVNVSNPLSPSRVLNVPTLSWGNEPEVYGDFLYMAAEAPWGFLIFDLDNRWNPIPIITQFVWFNTPVHVSEVDGTYAYVGLDDDNLGFRVVDISNPYNPTQEASLDVGEEVNAIALSGPIAFVGTEDINNSLQVINIADPENPTIATSLDVGGEIQDLVVLNDILYAAIDEQNAGLAGIDITNPFNPSLIYNLDVTGKGTGVDADMDQVYVTTDTSNKGLVIVRPSSSAVAVSGTYISDQFDTGSADVEYHFIEWDHTEVPGGSVKLQMRTANSLGNLNSATWVGPDGTAGTYYENPRTIITLDPGRSGSRYCQFIVYFESDGVTTPVVNSIRLSFTP